MVCGRIVAFPAFRYKRRKAHRIDCLTRFGSSRPSARLRSYWQPAFSTLICCALPSVLVLLGMGTTVASLLSAAPWLVSLSRHKAWTFSIAGVLIAMSFVTTYLIAPRLRQREVCDAGDPTTCGEVSKISRVILWGSAFIWSCGFFVAYLLGLILERTGR
jgi:mercuric ion transport protein